MASTAASLHPVRMPGSTPSTARGPSGASSSRRRTFSAKTTEAAASAASLSTRCTSFSIEVRTLFLKAIRPAWRRTSAPGESGTVQAADSNAATSRASNSASWGGPVIETWSSSSAWPRRTAR